MDWRREDTGYAAATAGVISFVAYLLAANFGLVPSPFAPLLDGSSPPTVASVAAPSDIADGTLLPVPPPASAVIRASATPPPATAEVTDTDKPAVAFSTQDGATFGLTEPAIVRGTARDAGAGIEKVVVAFATSSGRQVVPADVTCDPDRRSCTWTAEVPAVLASYAVTARATDEAGNVAETAPIDVTVVNTGGAVEEVGEVGGRVPGALVDAVTGLLDGLGG